MKEETNTQSNSVEEGMQADLELIPGSMTTKDESLEKAQEEAQKESNFHKIFLLDFLNTLEPLANQKTKICYWIIKKMNHDNYLHATFRQIATETNTSYGTVAETMKLLQKNNFLCKINSGRYIVNPDIIFKGSLKKRMMIRDAYQNAVEGSTMTSDEKQLKEYTKQINELKKQAISLKKKIAIINSNK